MQTGSVKMKSLSAIAGVLLSALAATACAVDDPADAKDDQLVDPAESTEIQGMAIPDSMAEISKPRSANQLDLQNSPGSVSSAITTKACRTVCKDVVHPERCFFIPPPFCLIPVHECATLCDVP